MLSQGSSIFRWMEVSRPNFKANEGLLVRVPTHAWTNDIIEYLGSGLWVHLDVDDIATSELVVEYAPLGILCAQPVTYYRVQMKKTSKKHHL